jgi:methionine-rich copper-binding protein CopC
MEGFRRIAASSLLLAMLGALGQARPAWSHAEMVTSSPAAGAVLTKAPSEIRAWFDDELTVKGSTLRLYDAHSKLLATGGVDPKVSKHDVMRIASPHLAAGGYLVRWHAVSADDNKVTEGSFRFSIKGDASMSLPPLQVIQPANRATVKNPVTLKFDTPADMMKFTMGGMASMEGMGSGLHLHIVVDGTTLMPTGEQVTPIGNHRYTYALPRLRAGSHTLKVYWADNKTHGAQGPVHTSAFTCSG